MFEEALHTYFAVGDVRQARLSGLSGAAYLDKNRDMARLIDSDDLLVLTEPSDRVYLGTKAACVIDDPAGKRRITVDKEGSDTTVVWNPWSNPAKPMADMAEDEWLKFICVETANAKDYAVTLVPEATHTMRAIVRSERT
jgi:glucose-6-phosphate 1-epimerase